MYKNWQKIGFTAGSVYMEIGDHKSGLLHLMEGHGAEIRNLYPDVPFHKAVEMFMDEFFSKLKTLHGSYVGRGKHKRLEGDSSVYAPCMDKRKNE